MDIGYEWRKAEKRRPRPFEVFKFRKVEVAPDPRDEELALWNGERYYIFSRSAGKWMSLEKFYGIDDSSGQRAELLGYEYAYIPSENTQYVPFWAIANSCKNDIFKL